MSTTASVARRRAPTGRPRLELAIAGFGFLLVGFLVGTVLGPEQSGRVAVVNDTRRAVTLFDCDTPGCAGGAVVSVEVLQPGHVTTDYWTDSRDRSVVGIATRPGGRLVGCLFDPPNHQGPPPNAGVAVSQATQCPG